MRPQKQTVSGTVIKLRQRPGLRSGTPARQRKGGQQRYALRKTRSITYVYIFVCEGFHKVGISRDPSARLIDMQNHCPFQIQAVAYRRIPRLPIYYERLIHAMLKDHRMHGEWFNAPLDLIRSAVETAFTIMQKPSAAEELSAAWVGTPGGTVAAVPMPTVTAKPFTIDED